ncbi:trihelix transcription factor PTL-like [Bidens hawaiensis]|uniref:trihelix transcription factor PTL-like n=1 Tax=Bidens hawaiensis TaxID=980011 RepID=UPI00404B52E8
MENYGMMDLVYPTIPQPPGDHLHYAMVMLGGNGGGINPFGSDSIMGIGPVTSGLSGDSGSGCGGGGGNGLEMEIGGRWPKEETLALLDIRVKLNSKFKEAKHKGHLWDEVSRTMCVEHGYKRSGKKCSEKFENLYKYYKKIKEGKARRQDKKHYRFFHQLEAIYGETTANASAVSVDNIGSPPFLDDNYHPKTEGKRWKTKITDFIETKMNTIMEKQDKWMEKVMNTIEERERERILKEKQWRKEEVARFEREKTFLSNERERMKYREAAFMEALHKLTKNESTLIDTSRTAYCNDQGQVVSDWGENETTQLIELISLMETRFEKCGFTEDVLWEDIAITMASLGYNRSALVCKAKWDHINFVARNKKQKGCSNSYYGYHNHNFNQAGDRRFVTFNDQQTLMINADDQMMWNYYGKIKENI